MANISDAFGEIIVPEQYYELFQKFVEKYEAPAYGVTYWEFKSPYQGEFIASFSGAGRWTFYRAVEDPEWFFNTEENPLGTELIEKFKEDKIEISIHYCDEEPGCQVLYEFSGVMDFSDGEYRLMEAESIDYPYTSRNLARLFEDDVLLDLTGDNAEEELDYLTEQYINFHFSLQNANKKELKNTIREYIENEPSYDGVLRECDWDCVMWNFSGEIQEILENKSSSKKGVSMPSIEEVSELSHEDAFIIKEQTEGRQR